MELLRAGHLMGVWGLAFPRAWLPWRLSAVGDCSDDLCKRSCSFTGLEHRGSSSRSTRKGLEVDVVPALPPENRRRSEYSVVVCFRVIEWFITL